MPTIVDTRGEPEVVVADLATALQPTIAGVLATRGPAVTLAVIILLQDWVANVSAGASSDEEIADWIDQHTNEALDLSDKAHMVLKLRAMGAMGRA